MVTKGVVEEIIGYKAKVRLPIFDDIASSSTSIKSKDLSSATLCSLANADYALSIGDVVYVAFEDNDNDKPVILGHLYREKKTNTTPGLSLSTLSTTSTTKLSEETYIGNVSPLEIKYLTGTTSNIQDQIDKLSDRINNISISGGSGGSIDLSDITDRIDILEYQASSFNSSINSINTKIVSKANLNQTGGLQLKSGALEFDDDSNTFWTSSNLNIGGNINAVGIIYQNGKELAEKDHIHSNYLTLIDTQTLIDNSISNLIADAPTTLDTLKEIADAVQENKDLIEAIKASKTSVTFREWN